MRFLWKVEILRHEISPLIMYIMNEINQSPKYINFRYPCPISTNWLHTVHTMMEEAIPIQQQPITHDQGPRPDISRFDGFHHLVLWVANAKQASTFYCVRFGFREVAYRGLETGDREYCSRVLQQGRIFLVLKSPLNPGETEVNHHIQVHGDGVRDVAFKVDDARNVFEVPNISLAFILMLLVCCEKWSQSCSWALGGVWWAWNSRHGHNQNCNLYWIFTNIHIYVVWWYCSYICPTKQLYGILPSRLYSSLSSRSHQSILAWLQVELYWSLCWQSAWWWNGASQYYVWTPAGLSSFLVCRWLTNTHWL